MKPLILIGGGGHCRSCIDVIESSGQYEITGIVERDNNKSKSVMGYPLLGTDDDLQLLLRQCRTALVTVGQIKSADIRIHLFERINELGADLCVIVSPHAYVSRHAHIAAGSIVMHGALINAKVAIGENCIINSRALIEHDTIVESHCHISTGAIVNGGVHVEEGCFVGSGAVIHESVRIGARSVVGAGTIVLSDTPAGTVVRGTK